MYVVFLLTVYYNHIIEKCVDKNKYCKDELIFLLLLKAISQYSSVCMQNFGHSHWSLNMACLKIVLYGNGTGLKL